MMSRRSVSQRLIGLAGLAVIVGVAVAVLLLAGVVGNQSNAEAVDLVETPPAPEHAGLEVGPEVGKLAPDFVISDFDGERHRLSDFRGKVVYVNFWATWCVPCQVELPDIARLQEENPDDLVVVAVNRRESTSRARDYFEVLPNLEGGKGVSFAVEGVDPDDTLYEAYRGLGMPTSMFVDAEGVVAARADGLLRLDEMQEAVQRARVGGCRSRLSTNLERVSESNGPA